jgi:hypothetical protein
MVACLCIYDLIYFTVLGGAFDVMATGLFYGFSSVNLPPSERRGSFFLSSVFASGFLSIGFSVNRDLGFYTGFYSTIAVGFYSGFGSGLNLL